MRVVLGMSIFKLLRLRLDLLTSRLRFAHRVYSCEDHASAAAAATTSTAATVTAATPPQHVALGHLALASPVAWKSREEG
ncbi:hypothetical protein DFH11DRAFT_1600684 [Phellopilus nigrolimitatus]|nr:hypothetical protein DFH11DRAFT_1600684 [Phellopilus nigrolimitatus]